MDVTPYILLYLRINQFSINPLRFHYVYPFYTDRRSMHFNISNYLVDYSLTK